MNYIAAEFELEFDHSRMEQELLGIPSSNWLYRKYNEHHYKSLFLTINDYQVFTDFKSAKTLKHSDWRWDPSLDIPYTKSVIESLPNSELGMVRAMWTDGPLPMHIDFDKTTQKDITYSMGVTIAPILHEPMTMIKDILVFGNTILFDDSKLHGFPQATTSQLGVRIFANFNYDKFKITKVYKTQ